MVDRKDFRSIFAVGRGPGLLALLLGSSMLVGCTVLSATGPTTRAVAESADRPVGNAKIHVVDVTDAVAGQVNAVDAITTFSGTFGDGVPVGTIVSRGDTIDISIWEAPPAVLFGTISGSELAAQSGTMSTVARSTPLSDQMVGDSGAIFIPFAGSVQAAGRTTQQIAADIRARLIGKAHDPQVIVRLSRNATSNVTIVGEVSNSVRMPLTARGERLLDALASAGGVKQPVNKMTVQLTRGEKVDAMPLSAVIRDPRQNIRLQASDVVTLLYQPYSFTVLGAASKNEEVSFEGTGLTLSQALGRMGGLEDQRANPKGVFIFRFEDPKVFVQSGQPLPLTKDGKVPVIYRVNMRDPATLFVAQSFPIRDKDVVYVSNAPLADFSKFLQAVSQIVYPIAVIQTTSIF